MKRFRKKIRKRNFLFDWLFWFIQLRWLAALGVVLTILAAQFLLRITLPAAWLYSVGVAIFLYNILFISLILRYKRKLLGGPWLVELFANVQIALDLTCLAVLIHFSGGIENPFVFYFIFHMIIASILLTPKAAFLQTTYAVGLLLGIVLLEFKGIIAHYPLWTGGVVSLYDKPLYALGIWGVFASTAYIAVYMTTTISVQLKNRERRLSEANVMLSDNDRIKSKYVLRMTHDIKEDLAAIYSCIEPVTEGVTGALNKQQEDLLERARHRSKKLVVFVNSLLEITKIKLIQKFKMERFLVPGLVDDIAERIQARAKVKGVVFVKEIGANVGEVRGVRVYIHEVFVNLLENAVRHTPRGGKVTLSVENMRAYWQVRVADTGDGIAKEDLPHVFDEFYQAEKTPRQKREGSGLGLAIVKEIVDMHRGHVGVESELGKGTTFTVRLPV